MVNVFEGCTDACGWTAALVAALAYGSFGVPVKATKHINVHPLVLQSYKTLVVFVLSWAVPLLGVEVGFTKWGILSGLLWVVGGTGGIYGIRMAGLAIAVGTWASIMILVNFIFGILIFGEPVHDVLGTLTAFGLLIVGLVGMSHYSAQTTTTTTNTHFEAATTSIAGGGATTSTTTAFTPLEDPLTDNNGAGNNNNDDYPHSENDSDTDDEENTIENRTHYVLFGLPLTKRQCGILGAAMNGVFTGGSLIPLHYAKKEGYGGANYMISMACGAFLANCLIWIGILLYNMYSKDLSVSSALDSLPRLYISQLWRPGCMAGVLLSIAMFGSILAVTYLGQAVGNSLVQTKILVSGLWGIFWYKEIRGTGTIAKWFLSAFIAVAAIIWLSLERLMASGSSSGGHRFLLELA